MIDFCFSLDPKLKEYCQGTDLKPEDFLPTKTHDNDTGYDVRCANKDGIKLYPNRYFMAELGWKVLIPDGWWIRLVSRSSTFVKKHIINLDGTIDEGYENYCKFAGVYLPDFSILNPSNELKFGDRIAQIIPLRRENIKLTLVSESEFASKSEKKGNLRKEKGFGDSGNR